MESVKRFNIKISDTTALFIVFKNLTNIRRKLLLDIFGFSKEVIMDLSPKIFQILTGNF